MPGAGLDALHTLIHLNPTLWKWPLLALLMDEELNLREVKNDLRSYSVPDP